MSLGSVRSCNSSQKERADGSRPGIQLFCFVDDFQDRLFDRGRNLFNSRVRIEISKRRRPLGADETWFYNRLRKSPPDLVVMGSHGHSGVGPLTLGISLADGQRAVVRG